METEWIEVKSIISGGISKFLLYDKGDRNVLARNVLASFTPKKGAYKKKKHKRTLVQKIIRYYWIIWDVLPKPFD